MKTENIKFNDRIAAIAASDSSEKEKKREIISLATDLLAEEFRPGNELTSPEKTIDFLRLKIGDYKNEIFGAIFLDKQNRVLSVRELFQGTIDGAAVYPRVVAQHALDDNAAAVIFFHNHPSGVSEPSRADEAITRRLSDSLNLLDVCVLDHFIVTKGRSYSFAQNGLL